MSLFLQKRIPAYKTLRDLEKWGPSIQQKDRITAVNLSGEANVLVRNNGNGKNNNGNRNYNNNNNNHNKNSRKCYKCGSTSHFLANCPQGQKERTGLGQGQGANWNNKPPRLGAPDSKTVNGMEYHWCGKCN
jgi:Zinc knuckle